MMNSNASEYGMANMTEKVKYNLGGTAGHVNPSFLRRK